MLLLPDVDEYSFANADILLILSVIILILNILIILLLLSVVILILNLIILLLLLSVAILILNLIIILLLLSVAILTLRAHSHQRGAGPPADPAAGEERFSARVECLR